MSADSALLPAAFRRKYAAYSAAALALVDFDEEAEASLEAGLLRGRTMRLRHEDPVSAFHPRLVDVFGFLGYEGVATESLVRRLEESPFRRDLRSSAAPPPRFAAATESILDAVAHATWVCTFAGETAASSPTERRPTTPLNPAGDHHSSQLR